MISGALFDLDGTLVDNMAFHFAAWRSVAAEHGVALDDARIQREFAGKKNVEIIPALLGREVDAQTLREIADHKEALYRSLYAGKVKLIAGAGAYLAFLRARGVKVAIASAAPAENRAFVLDALGVRDRFDAIVGGEEVTRGKPSPDIFLLAAERLGVSPRQCIAFEDAVLGVHSAVAAGALVIGITSSEPGEALLAAGAVRAFADFTEAHQLPFE